MLLFELIYQRTKAQSRLLIVLDEPFAGVTDDFVPWISGRLDEMSKNHNILLVTNDHVETITDLADNTITVSAIDRTKVTINNDRKVDREKAIMALSLGDEYQYKSTGADLKFFFDVEVSNNAGLMGVAGFTVFAFALFLVSFWNSTESSGPLVLVAGMIIGYFAIQPYLLSFVDWRTYMTEEAEALLHASKGMNKMMKTLLTMFLILVVSFVEYFCVIAVIDGYSTFDFWVAMFFDSASMTFPFICFGLYTSYSHQVVEMLASMPFLFMIFFSTTFSPGSGVQGLKELRYLFSRFYFWCMIPSIQDEMENCPESSALNLLYLVLSGLLGVVLFLAAMGINTLVNNSKQKKANSLKERLQDDDEFISLQLELYGAKNLRKLQRADSLGDTIHSNDTATNKIENPTSNSIYNGASIEL